MTRGCRVLTVEDCGNSYGPEAVRAVVGTGFSVISRATAGGQGSDSGACRPWPGDAAAQMCHTCRNQLLEAVDMACAWERTCDRRQVDPRKGSQLSSKKGRNRRARRADAEVCSETHAAADANSPRGAQRVGAMLEESLQILDGKNPDMLHQDPALEISRVACAAIDALLQLPRAEMRAIAAQDKSNESTATGEFTLIQHAGSRKG